MVTIGFPQIGPRDLRGDKRGEDAIRRVEDSQRADLPSEVISKYQAAGTDNEVTLEKIFQVTSLRTRREEVITVEREVTRESEPATLNRVPKTRAEGRETSMNRATRRSTSEEMETSARVEIETTKDVISLPKAA